MQKYRFGVSKTVRPRKVVFLEEAINSCINVKLSPRRLISLLIGLSRKLTKIRVEPVLPYTHHANGNVSCVILI